MIVDDPEGLARDALFEVRANGQVLGVVPSTSPDDDSIKRLSLSSTVDLSFDVQLPEADAAPATAKRYGCKKVSASVSVKRSGQVRTVVFAFTKNHEPCREMGGMAVPDHFTKLALRSQPDGTRFIVAKPGDGKPVTGSTPSSVTVWYDCDHVRTVVFQKSGYFDCVKQVEFRCENRTVAVIDGQRSPVGSPDANSPGLAVSCTLAPMKGKP